MLQIVDYNLTIPSFLQARFVDNVIDSYIRQSRIARGLASEVDVIGGVINILEEASSYNLYGDSKYYLKIKNDNEQMDFGMCSESFYDGYLSDVIMVLNTRRLSFYNDNYDEFYNFPITKVW